MDKKEKTRKLHTLPWQALFDLALKHGIDENEIKNKEKSEIIKRLLLRAISDTEIDQIVDDFIYGTRVTFTFWSFSQNLSDKDILLIMSLEDTKEEQIKADGFRNLHFLSVKKYQDRLEVLYSYSKEYSFTSEEGKTDAVWELHRGCLWIGVQKNYLASISKHEAIQKSLLSTSKEGQEIIRQFVEQGMNDSRVQLISIIAPQYFDSGFKGTLRMLARLGNKKIMFIGLDELCKLIAQNEKNIGIS